MVYLLAYVLMNVGAFLVVTLIHAQEGTFDLRDYPGLYRRAPFLTLAMAVFLLSLIGIPPFVGFMGKLYIFQAVIARGPEYYWFAAVGAVNAAVGAYFYFRVLRTMTIDDSDDTKPRMALAPVDNLAVGALALANLLPVLLPAFWSMVEGWVGGWTRESLVLFVGR
jgi:NADH-quinone oxidoreductase subunit N